MMIRLAAGLTCACLLLLSLIPATGLDARPSAAPDRLDDAAFWRLFTEMSEPGGYFRSDNLVSNERTFPRILPDIARRASRTGAYVGVGPEQNFSYLATLRPRLAFIVDIRRQNAMLHLLYKALVERSPSRAEFLSRLFSRPRARHLGPRSSARELMEAFNVGSASADLYADNVRDIKSHLVERHGFALTAEDLDSLQYVYSAFFESGPTLSYSARSGRRGRPFPMYAELMAATDEKGVARSFLATEESYLALRDLHLRNLIVPVVGDFAGEKALKAVGAYLRTQGLTVTTFYTSNVEFYLFRDDAWRRFYENLAAMPVSRQGVLVRSIFRGPGGFGGPGFPGWPGPGFPGGSLEGRLVLDPIGDLVAAFRRGDIQGYGDILARTPQERPR